MTDQNATPEKRPANLVYLGLRLGDKQQRRYAYAIYETEGQTIDSDDELWFAKPLYPASPGTCITVQASTASGTHTIYQPAKYIGQWPNDEQVLAWQAKTQAIETALRSQAKEKEQKTKNLVHTTLDPLRKAMKAMTYQERRTFAALVLEYLLR